jgi:hypothetical protein
MFIRLIALVVGVFYFSGIASAAEQTYLREYTYQASEIDSKVTARAIALQEVKRLLLSELGTHVSALVKQQSTGDGNKFNSEQIETLSAGVTSVQILDEKWNGVTYVLKAQIKADPAEVLKDLNKMLDADAKQKQISQLSSDLSKVSSQKIQIAESLIEAKNAADAAMAEIARLKKQLEEKQTDASLQILKASYQNQSDRLTLTELVDSALKNYNAANYSEALVLWQKAAELGSARAQNWLGVMYERGEGVPQSYTSAFEWFQKAADQDYDLGQGNIGVLFLLGRGVPQNDAKAFAWFKKAADQGVAQGQFSLGLMYASGRGTPQNYVKAAELLKKAADQGLAGAQSILGSLYSEGLGVHQDFVTASEWYKKAAIQGDASAQFDLGVMYTEGRGVPRNDEKAAGWYQKAADQGLASAQNELGQMYEAGKGVLQSYSKAAEWYQKSADQGKPYGQFRLGGMYYTGHGVPINKSKALEWFQKAANQGYAPAQNNLGAMYFNGISVKKNVKEAVYWFQKAADQGNTDAQNNLAVMNADRKIKLIEVSVVDLIVDPEKFVDKSISVKCNRFYGASPVALFCETQNQSISIEASSMDKESLRYALTNCSELGKRSHCAGQISGILRRIEGDDSTYWISNSKINFN